MITAGTRRAHQARPIREWVSHYRLPALAAALVFVAVGWGWWQFSRSEVLSYGAPDQIFFSTTRATEGDKIEICFSGLDWKRLCPGQFVTQFTPYRGPRFDLPVHNIIPPPKEGPILGTKCRAWEVPTLGPNREEGLGFMSGYNASYCSDFDRFYPIYQTLPRIPIDVRRKH